MKFYYTLFLTVTFIFAISDVLSGALDENNFDNATIQFINAHYDEWLDYTWKYDGYYDSPKYKYTSVVYDLISNYVKTKKMVENHNKLYRLNHVSFQLEINRFADWSSSQLQAIKEIPYSKNNDVQTSRFLKPFHVRIPDSLNWTNLNYVTPVLEGFAHYFEEQSESISFVHVLETQRKRKVGELKNLTPLLYKIPQRGNTSKTMTWIYKYFQNLTEIIDIYGLYVTGYANIKSGDEEELKVAVATQGPIFALIDASDPALDSYKSGVYYNQKCSNVSLNHAVLVVGYGNDSTFGEYWIVKNSWGKDWGENGYIRMSRNRNNNCGIATSAGYPLCSFAPNIS